MSKFMKVRENVSLVLVAFLLLALTTVLDQYKVISSGDSKFLILILFLLFKRVK